VKRWWVRPLVRTVAAFVLPLAVPLLLTMLLWALPGDPASIVCPPENCSGTEALAERWNLDQGPMHYFTEWLVNAANGELGNSWRMQTGAPVSELVFASVPNTLALIGLAFVPILLGTVLAALDVISRRLDPVLHFLGLFPAVILAVMAAAWKVLTYSEFGGETAALFLGAAVLGLADGAFSGAVTGTRSVASAERRQRYTGVGVLRGETELSNILPNITPALVGQLRARILHLFSGAVVVEVVLKIDGLGDLLWQAALVQDFGVVLPVATVFACFSAALLLMQALAEGGVAVWIRWSPSGVLEGAA
jgi:ABC-type dipeptide/oligopeptide/nickel transport system permease component